MKNQPLNRVVAVVAVICTLIMAIVPVAANFDWTSTAGILGGIVAVAAVTLKWLEGWQKFENHPSTVAQFKADPNDTRTHPHGREENDLSTEVIPNA